MLKTRKLKISLAYKGKKYRPMLRLCGNYLLQAGFTPGMQVEITHENGCLTIKPLQP